MGRGDEGVYGDEGGKKQCRRILHMYSCDSWLCACMCMYQAWLEAATPARVGIRCRLQSCGKWYAAVVTDVSDGWISCVNDHDGTEDGVSEGSLDICCEPPQ